MRVEFKDKEGNDCHFTLDGILAENMIPLKKVVKKDWDFLFVIDGMEGAGKSVLAQQLAYFLSDGKFTINQICYTPEEFKDAILAADKYQAVVFDEAFRGLSSRAAMSATNKILTSLLQEIRQKNLFVFIVLPSIWDVDKYVALHRCAGLIHVHVGKNRERGFFRFYKKNDIAFMFRNRAKYLYTHPPKSAFYGRFSKTAPIDQEEYKAKKLKSLQEFGNAEPETVNREAEKWKDRFLDAYFVLKTQTPLKVSEIAEKLGVNRRSLSEWEGSRRQKGGVNVKNLPDHRNDDGDVTK